jgi:hypothetical protein
MGKALGVAMSDPTLESLTVTGAVSVGGALAVTGSLNVAGGAALGNAAADTLAFHGVTPVAQQAATNQAAPASTAPVSISATQWGFSTSTQAARVINCLLELRTALVTLGLIKGSE